MCTLFFLTCSPNALLRVLLLIIQKVVSYFLFLNRVLFNIEKSADARSDGSAVLTAPTTGRPSGGSRGSKDYAARPLPPTRCIYATKKHICILIG